MKKKMNDKQKIMAYVLQTDADLNYNKKITQSDIAGLFGVSQSTIAQGIKETKYKMQISELHKELSSAKKQILEMKNEEGIKALDIVDTCSSEYKRLP